MAENNHEYFFELLAEEIPAWMHEAAQATLRGSLLELSAELGVAGDSDAAVTVDTTPRRIAFLLSRLPLQESDREIEVKGPPRKAAYAADGSPTPALLGFLRKNNATPADIIDEASDVAPASAGGPGQYVRIRKQLPGRTSEDILRERIPEIVQSLRWPKMMRWGNGEHSWIRPVHSIISLFDDRPVPITMFGTTSGTKTVGHRTLAPQPIEIRSWGDYVSKLELAHVVIDPVRRRHVMAERARVLGNEVEGTPSIDAPTWAQWQYLTEYPGVVRAEFRREYLSLPEEVLITVMRVHQKQLPIREGQGKLTQYFLAVLDNESDPDGNAAYGNSFVTNARFADAKFFYETDRKRSLSDRVESLSHLQFHEKLGSYLEKTRRIEAIVAAICRDLQIDESDPMTAAVLSKADLVTEMVKEFTDLQGKIGGIYAREEGYDENVWQAIYDHYLPTSIDDELPRNLAGAIVSIADKIDTLTGFFGMGAKPTGSKDPFALRRAAQGIVQILLGRDKREVRIGLDRLIDMALEAHGQTGMDDVKRDLLAFFSERVRNLLEGRFAYDEVSAAMEAGWAGSLTDLTDRAAAIRQVRDQANFLSILDSAKRIANITAGHDSTTVDIKRLETATERRLSELASVVSQQIDEMIAERRYRQALESFAALAPELETFFKDVMVMVDDENLRRNRMSLLRKVGTSVGRIADVTRIVVDRSEYRA
jgi:glycyl-tRNA synthetase beta chain